MEVVFMAYNMKMMFFRAPEGTEAIHLTKHFSYASTPCKPRQIAVLLEVLFHIFSETHVSKHLSELDVLIHLPLFESVTASEDDSVGVLGAFFRVNRGPSRKSGKMQR